MAAAGTDQANDGLGEWAHHQQRRRLRRSRRTPTTVPGGVQFAFYGRMSTEDYQDYATSRAWQRNAAEEVVASKGAVVVEFFDRGCSRRVEWADRPAAGMLLAALADPDRGFDAVVVGEYERAFLGDQLTELLPVFARYGVQVLVTGDQRPGRRCGSDPSRVGDVVGCAVQTGGAAVTVSGVGSDASPSCGAGPLPGWPSAVRLPPGRCRGASEHGACALGSAVAAAGA